MTAQVLQCLRLRYSLRYSLRHGVQVIRNDANECVEHGVVQSGREWRKAATARSNETARPTILSRSTDVSWSLLHLHIVSVTKRAQQNQCFGTQYRGLESKRLGFQLEVFTSGPR